MYLRKSGTSFFPGSRNACQRTAYAAVCILFTLFFMFTTGCSSLLTPKTNWQNADFTCHATFPPYEADFSRTQGTFTMVLSEPQNLAGLMIVCTPDGKYTLSCGETVIPLGENVSAGLGDFPGVLAGLTGRVELDEEGYPLVLHTTAGQGERTVQLTNFSVYSPPSADGSEER